MSHQAYRFHLAVTAGWHSSSVWDVLLPSLSLLCQCVCCSTWVCWSILLWLPLLPLTCHPCSMTACRRWPGMVWDMEYPWAKLDCKTLLASSTLGMTPSRSSATSVHSFRSPLTPPPPSATWGLPDLALAGLNFKYRSRMLNAKWGAPAVTSCFAAKVFSQQLLIFLHVFCAALSFMCWMQAHSHPATSDQHHSFLHELARLSCFHPLCSVTPCTALFVLLLLLLLCLSSKLELSFSVVN